MLSQTRLGIVGLQPYVPADVQSPAPALSRLLDDAGNAMDRDTVRSCPAQSRFLPEKSVALDNQSIPVARRGGFAPWQEQRVKNHIEAHLDEPIRVADLARISRLSAGYFSVVFRQSFGSSLQTFLAHRRVERAKTLMLSTDLTLTAIALACGFCDQAHFCRRFRRIAGSTPTAWRRAWLFEAHVS